MDEKNSDKALIIRHAIDTCGIPCDKALMIGDRKFDIRGAKVNNIDSVGVLYGYGSYSELTGEQTTYIVDKPEEIFGIVLG
jgi:phosphoglycolate phosphatase